jgi:AraC-like DNA-binding protein
MQCQRLRQEMLIYLAFCLASETAPRVDEVSRILKLARRTLITASHRCLGVSPATFLKTAQLSVASYLLATTVLPTQTIGYMAGYGTRRTFYRHLKTATGLTPQVLRAQIVSRIARRRHL